MIIQEHVHATVGRTQHELTLKILVPRHKSVTRTPGVVAQVLDRWERTLCNGLLVDSCCTPVMKLQKKG